MNKPIISYLIIFVFATQIQAQTNTEKQVNNVFNQLVLAYGNAKSAPLLEIINDKKIQKTPAFYSPTSKPVIKVDAHFYKLCQSFGKDSLNALSIVMSHELAHYYNDHSFCSDFAFAMRDKNKELALKLKTVSKNEKMSSESQADYQGLFYAAIAGFHPFEVHSKLLDAIYKTYQLADVNAGYPSKTERKEMANSALQKANSLYLTFQKGLAFKENKKYNEAIKTFEELNNYFPSRENYNNIGVMKTLQALEYQVLTSELVHYPKRFLYPLETDNTSRLNQNGTRSNGSEEDQQKMVFLLKSAQKDFEKAISLDPNYTKAYINLACVFDLLDNPEAAIGKIKELSKEQQNATESLRILAIAYYHAEYEQKAEQIWKELKI
ncbi:tetratricopeptide repeat protein [Flavobacterium branchiophilum]|nr:tetratricopeptide repeat protein [Flavobacterium branchiophilum]